MNFLSNFSSQVLLTVEVIWNRYPRGLVKYDPEVPLKSFYLANQCKCYILFHNRSVFLFIVKQYSTPSHTYKNLYPQEDVLCLSGSFKDLPPPLMTQSDTFHPQYTAPEVIWETGVPCRFWCLGYRGSGTLGLFAEFKRSLYKLY